MWVYLSTPTQYQIKMTNNQQQIINSLISEFDRMNQSNNANNGFNLIDIKPLKTKTTTQKEWLDLQTADEIAWEKLANEECYRIIDLLKQDIPNACIQKYGAENGFGDYSTILIRKTSQCSTHYDCAVRLEVKVDKVYKMDEHGKYYKFGDCLKYRPYPNIFASYQQNDTYKTLEEAVSDKAFLEAIRTRVL